MAPVATDGLGWMPRNVDVQNRNPDPAWQPSSVAFDPAPTQGRSTATSISGEVRHFNAVRAQNGPSLWQFRVERYDSITGQRLQPIAVELKYVTKGATHDGDHVTAHGQFDEAGMFQATQLINHSSRTTINASSALDAAKPLWIMMGCFSIPVIIVAVIFLLLIVGGILMAINN